MSWSLRRILRIKSFLRRCFYITDVFQLANKPITAPRYRLDVFWSFRGIVQGFAKAGDCAVEAVIEIHKRIRGPELQAQLLTRDGFPWMLHQHGQYLKGLFLQFDLAALPA
jgi:hypothetical protein